MPVSIEQIKTCNGGKYSKLPDADILAAILEAEANCGDAWADDRNTGVFLYTLHILECEWQQRITLAGASVAIAQGQAGNPISGNTGDWLDRTPYGQRFKELQKGKTSCSTTGFTV